MLTVVWVWLSLVWLIANHMKSGDPTTRTAVERKKTPHLHNSTKDDMKEILRSWWMLHCAVQSLVENL